MANIYQDKYILGQSTSGTITADKQEINLDLTLQPNNNTINGGNISGTVTNATGTAIQGAYVKLMSSTYEPLRHTVTDASGNYTFQNVAPGTYYIFAIASGMNLAQSPLITVQAYQYYIQNFSLTENPSSKLAIIAGDLTESGTVTAISGAIISLFLVASGTETLQAITYSNQYGQFVFRDVPKGSYVVKITALGYDSTSQNVTINADGQIEQVIKALTPSSPVTAKGTVSGIITNASGTPISGADVILYQVNTSTPNNPLTPIAFTKTNNNGVYLFAGVANGTYKVKSNELETVTVNI
ncbi:carboxypeptidase regulatory-like domain-containing protein [Clostridium botulinum]|uniref:Collagen-binding protein n=1 Tax=Clostridium botulinum C/D str. DC5 TaxID=1443128 RepID=A0A0A0IAT3_CLOBO|nr:carboxypeptidase-like regulatory domain-containing protein [Clostridium botulinum]KEI00482.1 collagen-binding protein [Clostridium botulinum C/D str. BKT75002]KEI07312.1 collagen-binding protein [Clostridium botulinum C/D str. BKT2873]KGM94578.1 collagen-binding protein [Clostridium botulinum D str. CCUG 7971]KGM98052.1 collagen-binding protein [Clostridium botulinum C/D str. DC5]KOC49450.1 collagen-binding protein [Clostridium botulinum]